MLIKKLDHVTLQTANLQRMIHWYTCILGLEEGERPSFSTPGAWLYAGDTVVVHLVELPHCTAVVGDHPLTLEHFAFSATGARMFQERLDAHGEGYRRVQPDAIDTVMYNLHDPDGNHIHVDFDAEELRLPANQHS